MIQLNLLPDVKMEYIKAQRTRNMVLSSAIIIALGSVALLVLLLIVGGLQKKHINDLSKDIKSNTANLQKKQDINKILTVQNQLQSLTALHKAKPSAANLFSYLNSATPVQSSISGFKIDFAQQTMEITGTADSLSSVNKHIDTLKFIRFAEEDNNDDKGQPAFSNVVMSSFALASGGGKDAVSYTITMSYDPAIFDTTKKVQLSIPNTVTTRAQINSVDGLFIAPTTNSEGGN